MKITKPNPDEYDPYYESYVSEVKSDDPIKELRRGKKQLIKLISKLNKKQLKYRYAEGKWTIKEILAHLMDAERIWGYRALRFARNDQTKLPGFEENDYVPASRATKRKIKSLLREYEAIRDSTIQLFQNLEEDMMMRMGTANEKPISVRAMMYITVGHELHHLGVIKDKYLGGKVGA